LQRLEIASSSSASVDRMAPDEVVEPDVDTNLDARVEDTVEALRAAARAAVEVGRQVLDAVERALDDPATAEKLAEVVAGFSRLADGMRPRAGDGGSTTRPSGDGGLEHIEVS
jgi:hypothetical protein